MQKISSSPPLKRFPYWLTRSVKTEYFTSEIRGALKKFNIETVCESALCPNIYDCFSHKRCTFLILGSYCSRSCKFCAIEKNGPLGVPEKKELLNIRDAIISLGIENVIITSVTRDDLEDGGASHFADCIKILRAIERKIKIEVLVPDFKGQTNAIEKVVSVSPDIFSHNIETVPRLYNRVRPEADYHRSLRVIKYAKNLCPDIIVKSGLMVGLGEQRYEVYNVMEDLKEMGCDIITIGQYLRPNAKCIEVEEYIHPEEFEKFSDRAKEMKFMDFSCSPFTRSSYYR